MDKDTLLNTIKEIGTTEDEVARRTLLASISDEVVKIYDENETNKNNITSLNETITKNEEEKETLRKANMELFLRVGENKSAKEVNENSTGIKEEEKASYKSYDELAKNYLK